MTKPQTDMQTKTKNIYIYIYSLMWLSVYWKSDETLQHAIQHMQILTHTIYSGRLLIPKRSVSFYTNGNFTLEDIVGFLHASLPVRKIINEFWSLALDKMIDVCIEMRLWQKRKNKMKHITKKLHRSHMLSFMYS